MANSNLGAAKKAKNDEFYTQFQDIQKEVEAYLEYEKNTFRNKEGNPVLFDMVLIDKVLAEKNISLFLNTIVYDIVKHGDKEVAAVKAYNSQSETE